MRSLPVSQFLAHISFLLLIALCVGITGLNLIVIFQPQKEVYAISSPDFTSQEIEFWKDIVAKHDSYAEGYKALYVLYTQQNDRENAQKMLDAINELDPKFEGYSLGASSSAGL